MKTFKITQNASIFLTLISFLFKITALSVQQWSRILTHPIERKLANLTVAF